MSSNAAFSTDEVQAAHPNIYRLLRLPIACPCQLKLDREESSVFGF